ncbi:DUF2637 domain-containing protein, partial [Streptomyces sp. SM12]|uniref:DUF2637 domain-containing protein n=1 Tax=Streptomyces sp. SM12 TaxID=1071602 RepID=UPI000CD5BE1E
DVDQAPAAAPASTPLATPAGQTTPAGPAARTLTRAQTAALTAIVVGALAVAAIGLYLSFSYVAAFAHEDLSFSSLRHGQLFALGVDAAILVLIGVDLVLAWLRRPVSWIRYPVWLLTAATVAINAASVLPETKGALGTLDYFAAGAHGLVPLLFIVIVEVGRHVIDGIVRPRAARQTIPAHRWILAPWPTWLLYRRMRLWGHGYDEILRRDADLRAYLIWLDRECDRRGSPATADELLPKSLAPYGITVADALALPDRQEREAHDRDTARRRRALALETQRTTDQLAADADREAAQADLDVTRARSAGRVAEARSEAAAQASAAERAAAHLADLEDTAEMAEARARTAEAERRAAEEQARSDEAKARSEDARARSEETAREAAEARARSEEETARLAAAAAERRREKAESEARTADSEDAAERSRLAAARSREAAARSEAAAWEADAAARLTPAQMMARWSLREIDRRAVEQIGTIGPQEAADQVHLLPLAEVAERWQISSTTAGTHRTRARALLLAGVQGGSSTEEFLAGWQATEDA